MKLFAPRHDRCLQWAGHRHAPAYQAGVSAAESVIFPIRPGLMLAPMSLARPQRWIRFATLCALASVVGGLIVYLLGAHALDFVLPLLERAGKVETFAHVQALSRHDGFGFVLVAAFTPILSKLFTIASGATGIGLVACIVDSQIGRGGRFFLVSSLIRRGGERMAGVLRGCIERLGWPVVVLLIGLVGWAWTR